MSRARTLADIAAIAGVTAATVARALAANPRNSENTRQRIVRIAEDHGFRPNQMPATFAWGAPMRSASSSRSATRARSACPTPSTPRWSVA